MKKLFLLTALFVAATFSSCRYDDGDIWNSVHGLEDRVAQLEELCKRMNTNISSLQTLVKALQNNDYVTGVPPVTKNGETVGYTITFTKSSPITIYHGQNGKDGANGSDGKDGVNGNDGHTPVIGIRQDTDGVYYWTLDGDWMLDNSGNKIKAEGRDGQNGSDGKDGQNGTDGKDGENGKDGITPQLKIEDGYWFVSTDNGSTWTNLGRATGEKGDAGGDSIFSGVVDGAEEVVFTLADGETIVLPKKKQLAITFAEGDALQFDVNETKTVHYTITGGSDKNIVKAEMQNLDGCYTLRITPTSVTRGTITIAAAVPTANNVVVSVSDGTQTIMTAIAVTIKPSLEENVISIETPGTLSKLLADYDKSSITELTIIGNLNSSDISTLKSLPNLAVLDMENVNINALSSRAFYQKTSLTCVKLPNTLKTIGINAFDGCNNLTSVKIGNSLASMSDNAFANCGLTSIIIPDCVTSIGSGTFWLCSNLTTITIGNGVISIGDYMFYGCSNLTSIYCKAQTPPELQSDGFDYWSNCTLYIPVGCKGAYA